MLSIIACISKANRAIGYQNRLLYHIKSDMTRFRELTTGHVIIMGRKTYESLPNGALPNRCNIVVSKSRKELPNCEVYASLEEALTAVTNKAERDKAEADKAGRDKAEADKAERDKAERDNTIIDKEYFIIGGESIYSQALPLADKLYLTLVNQEPSHADTFFPAINPEEWEVAEKEMRNENDLSFTFLTLYRKQ